jgi:hypothetical protein
MNMEQLQADDAAWFVDQPGYRKRVRRLHACEREQHPEIEPEMNITIISQLEPGYRTRKFINVPPELIEYVLHYGEVCVHMGRPDEPATLLLPGSQVGEKVLRWPL